jgi:hypothetical protein
MEKGVRGVKCGTTEIGFTGNSVKSSCLIRFFGGKADASVTVSRVAPTEFGGKSMFSIFSIIRTYKREAVDV